jgi:hypothetical protein
MKLVYLYSTIKKNVFLRILYILMWPLFLFKVKLLVQWNVFWNSFEIYSTIKMMLGPINLSYSVRLPIWLSYQMFPHVFVTIIIRATWFELRKENKGILSRQDSTHQIVIICKYSRMNLITNYETPQIYECGSEDRFKMHAFWVFCFQM